MADDDFIGLPPGMLDSGTFKSPPRTERRETEHKPVVFVPVVPGAPLPPVTSEPDGGTVADDASIEGSSPDPAVDTRRELADDFSPPAHSDHAKAGWSLELADGVLARVTSRLLIGRNPARLDSWHDAELLAVNDTTHSVSKTHAALEVDGSGLWVHDLDSTNGVWVVVGEDATEVSPGRRVAVPAGAVIELGEYELRVVAQ